MLMKWRSDGREHDKSSRGDFDHCMNVILCAPRDSGHLALMQVATLQSVISDCGLGLPFAPSITPQSEIQFRSQKKGFRIKK